MDKLLVMRTAAEFYLQSHDFNGIPIAELARRLHAPCDELRAVLRKLVQEAKITVLGDFSGNSHILGTSVPETARQLDALESADTHHTCVYVHPNTLAEFVPDDLYANEPYRRKLALGAPQFSFRTFDLAVLEHYRNDPRYHYENTDIDGKIYIGGEYHESTDVAEADKVLLETFGFAYDDDMNRAAAVFLRYLARLSAEHQQVWQTRELRGNYRIHADYYERTILGSWETNVSVCDAAIAEIHLINLMAVEVKGKNMFREDFGEYGTKRPRDFTLLIRPTLREFYSFVSLLDRMLSDNINKKFFEGDISFEYDKERRDGKIQVERKGTLRILNEWLRKHYRTDDWSPWEQGFATLREIRKIRQKPAHTLDDDQFDQKYLNGGMHLTQVSTACSGCPDAKDQVSASPGSSRA